MPEPITATLLGTSLASGAGAAGVGALGLGGLFGLSKLFGGKKKKQDQFNYYDTPEYRQLQSLLYQGSQEGVPGLEDYGQQRFQELMPGIQETYQAKRRLGAGSTPEVAALGRGAQGVATDVTGLQSQARQNYAQLLAGITPQPFFQQQGPGFLENALNLASPIASSYFQNQGLNSLLDKYFPSAAKEGAPDTQALLGLLGRENDPNYVSGYEATLRPQQTSSWNWAK